MLLVPSRICRLMIDAYNRGRDLHINRASSFFDMLLITPYVCNMQPSPGGRSKSLEEDDLDRIALIAHYIGGVSKDTGKRQPESDPKYTKGQKRTPKD